jgi:hypothetical protein
VKRMGKHDWYVEGARYLVGAQSSGGSWKDSLVSTSFALLFLKRGTVPVVLPAVTPK